MPCPTATQLEHCFLCGHGPLFLGMVFIVGQFAGAKSGGGSRVSPLMAAPPKSQKRHRSTEVGGSCGQCKDVSSKLGHATSLCSDSLQDLGLRWYSLSGFCLSPPIRLATNTGVPPADGIRARIAMFSSLAVLLDCRCGPRLAHWVCLGVFPLAIPCY